MPKPLLYGVWILNTLGLFLYGVWLVMLDERRLFYAQDGILFLLPCLPFFFVYMLLLKDKLQKKRKIENGEDPAMQAATPQKP